MMLWLMGSSALAVGAVSPSNGSMAVKFGGEEEIPCFLQVSMERQLPQAPEKKHHTHFHLGERWPLWVIRNHMQKGVVTPKNNSSGWQVAYEPEEVTPLLHSLGQFSKGMVIFLYVCLMIMVLAWLMRGLPKKAPQDKKSEGWVSQDVVDLFVLDLWFHLFHNRPVCPKPSADGRGPFRVPGPDDCNGANELCHQVSSGAGDRWHL